MIAHLDSERRAVYCVMTLRGELRDETRISDRISLLVILIWGVAERGCWLDEYLNIKAPDMVSSI